MRKRIERKGKERKEGKAEERKEGTRQRKKENRRHGMSPFLLPKSAPCREEGEEEEEERKGGESLNPKSRRLSREKGSVHEKCPIAYPHSEKITCEKEEIILII